MDALDSAAAGHVIYVPSISLVELTYLVEKGRYPSIARDRLINVLDDQLATCRLASLYWMVADALESINREDVSDLPDRIVSATAVALQVRLVSRDGKSRASAVQTIW